MISTLAAIALTCWVCTLIVAPPRPLPGNAIEERYYAPLLGRGRRVALLALAVTAVALFAAAGETPPRAGMGLPQGAPAEQVCYDGSAVLVTCYTPQANGTWVREELQEDGTWRVAGMSTSAPRPPREKDWASSP